MSIHYHEREEWSRCFYHPTMEWLTPQGSLVKENYPTLAQEGYQLGTIGLERFGAAYVPNLLTHMPSRNIHKDVEKGKKM